MAEVVDLRSGGGHEPLAPIRPGDPGWRAVAMEFRNTLDAHIREEEDEVFPAFRDSLSREENERLFSLLNWEGFKVA